MITTILGGLTDKISILSSQTDGGAAGAGVLDFFGSGVPTFFFQVIVGLYVIQIVYILSILINGIENGNDKLNERFILGNNLTRTAITYTIISFIIMLLFNIIAGNIMGSVGSALG